MARHRALGSTEGAARRTVERRGAEPGSDARVSRRRARVALIAVIGVTLLAAAGAERISAQGSPAEQQASPTVARAAAFFGQWNGEGSLFGAPFRGRLVFEPALGGAFLRLRFDSRMDRGRGHEPVMSAVAYYAIAADGGVSGGWFDTRGVQMALEGTLAAGAFTVVWTAPTETGRTTYRLLEDGGMEVVDEVAGPEAWREFGRALYRRSAPPGG